MSKHGTSPGALRISGSGLPGDTVIELGGEDITRDLTGLSLQLGVRDRPTCVLNVLLRQTDVEVKDARVTVADETRDLLVRLGWTPPAEETTS